MLRFFMLPGSFIFVLAASYSETSYKPNEAVKGKLALWT